MPNINKSDTDQESLKRTLRKKIEFVDMILKYSVLVGRETHAIGVASKLEGRGIGSYQEYFRELKAKGVVHRIQSIKTMKERDAVISEALRAGFTGATRNVLVHTYDKKLLLRHQAEWRKTLKDMERGCGILPGSSAPSQRQARWHQETIEKVLRIFKKLIECHVQYMYGLEVIRATYTSNAFKFLRTKKLIISCGSVKQTKPEILELSKKGYMMMTGISPTHVPPNAKVWEVKIEAIERDFHLLENEIRSRG